MEPKLLIAAMILWAAPLSSAAQDDKDDADKSNGVRAGYNMSDLVGEEEVDVRNGFYAGFYRNLIKVPLYSLSLGLEYNTAGAMGNFNELRSSYLALPINNRIKLGPVYFDGGADVGYMLSEQWFQDGNEVDAPEGTDAEPWDVMLHAGAGLKILFIGIEARYRYSLTEVYDGYRNTSVQLGLTTFF